jgi:hypothetical protein
MGKLDLKPLLSRFVINHISFNDHDPILVWHQLSTCDGEHFLLAVYTDHLGGCARPNLQ